MVADPDPGVYKGSDQGIILEDWTYVIWMKEIVGRIRIRFFYGRTRIHFFLDVRYCFILKVGSGSGTIPSESANMPWYIPLIDQLYWLLYRKKKNIRSEPDPGLFSSVGSGSGFPWRPDLGHSFVAKVRSRIRIRNPGFCCLRKPQKKLYFLVVRPLRGICRKL